MKRAGWLVWLVLLAFVLYLIWPRQSHAQPVMIIDQDGREIALCQPPLQLNQPLAGVVTCLISDTIYLNGFES